MINLGKNILTELEQNNQCNVIKEKFFNIYYILYTIDPQESEDFERRNEFYFQKLGEKNDSKNSNDHDHKHDSGCCDSNTTKSKFYIPENQMTFKEKTLFELTKFYKLKKDLPNILKFLSDRFFNIKGKNPSDWDEKVQNYILKEVMKEGVKHYFLGKLNSLIQHEGKKDSTSHLLVANPQQWYAMFPDSEIMDNLSSEVLQNLYKKEHPVVEVFLI